MEIPGRLPRPPARLGDLHPRYPAQQVGDAGGLQAVDIIAGEHRVGRAAVIAGFDLAIGADQDFGQLQGLFALEGVGEGAGGRQQREGQGEAGEIHGLSIGTLGEHNLGRFIQPMWERACSRRRPISQWSCRLTLRLREQARSHRVLHLSGS